MRYESMMIVDTAVARSSGDGVNNTIEALIAKCNGKNVDIENYGERKLAYTIGKRTRGAYYLVHFDMDGADVPKLRRELKLNDEIFRHMILLDGDSSHERRDLANPRYFNVDSIDSKSHFEKFDAKAPVEGRVPESVAAEAATEVKKAPAEEEGVVEVE